MSVTYEEAVKYFSKMPPTYLEDGGLDYEAMAGELLVEGVPFAEVKLHMDALANHP